MNVKTWRTRLQHNHVQSRATAVSDVLFTAGGLQVAEHEPEEKQRNNTHNAQAACWFSLTLL